jgi:hypothetical protein
MRHMVIGRPRLLCVIASSGVITVTPPGVVAANRLNIFSVRRTGLDSIPKSTLETNGRLDFEHQQEKTFGRRGQLIELGRAARAGGEMVEQCCLFSSVEYSSGQLSELCFESLVGGYGLANHRETTAKSAVAHGRFPVG